MNQATNVNIVPSYGQRGDLHFSQYDVGRTATINLYAVNEAYTIPLGATVKIQATKPSGLGFDVACTFSGSVVTVVSTETMTAEAGRFPCELRVTKDSDVIGTANFMFVVEASPHPDGVIDGDAEEVINEIKALVLQSEGYALGTQDGVPVDNTSPYYHNNSKWWSEHPVGGGFTEEFKQALLDCFENVAWIGNDGQDYYDALYNALYPPAEVISISAVYTQSITVYSTDSLDVLKQDLVVTATYDDTSTATVPSTDYTLSGTLTVGTSAIIVTYESKTTTFNVSVSSYSYPKNLNFALNDITLTDGYINDQGETASLENNKFYDELIPAEGFCLVTSNGSVYTTGANKSLRIAEYNSSEEFIARSYASNVQFIYGSNNPAYIKAGFTDASTVEANVTAIVGLNTLDTSICTIPDSSIDNDGNVVAMEGTSISDYLPLSESGYIVGHSKANHDAIVIVFYDSSKTFISRHTVNPSSYVGLISAFAIPNNTAYVRFRCPTTPNVGTSISYLNE